MSARDEGGAYARIRENLSELGLDAMAAGLPHWMSAVAAGEADFASAMLAMTSEEAEAKRRRGMPPARLSDDDSARRRYSFHALPIA